MQKFLIQFGTALLLPSLLLERTVVAAGDTKRFSQEALAVPAANFWRSTHYLPPIHEMEMARATGTLTPYGQPAHVATAKRAGSADLSPEEREWLNHQLDEWHRSRMLRNTRGQEHLAIQTTLEGTYLHRDENELIDDALKAAFIGTRKEDVDLHHEIGYRLSWAQSSSSYGIAWIDGREYTIPLSLWVMESGVGLLPRNQGELNRREGTLGAYSRVVYRGSIPSQLEIYIPRTSLNLLKKDNSWRLKKPLSGREELYLRQRAFIQDIVHEIAEFSLGMAHARVVARLEPLYGMTAEGITYRMARDILDAERREDTAYLSTLQDPDSFIPSTALTDIEERDNSQRLAKALAVAASHALAREKQFQSQVLLTRQEAVQAANAALTEFKTWLTTHPNKIERLVFQSLIHAVLTQETDHMEEPMANDFPEQSFTDQQLLEFLEMVFDDERTWRRLERALPLIYMGSSLETSAEHKIMFYERMSLPDKFPPITVFMGVMTDKALSAMAESGAWMLSNVVATQFFGRRYTVFEEKLFSLRERSGINYPAIHTQLKKFLLEGS